MTWAVNYPTFMQRDGNSIPLEQNNQAFQSSVETLRERRPMQLRSTWQSASPALASVP